MSSMIFIRDIFMQKGNEELWIGLNITIIINVISAIYLQ